jgi:hypothetical protein
MPLTLTTIDFHNSTSLKAPIDIVIRPSIFTAGTIGLLLPKLTFSNPEEATQGVTVIPLRPDDPIGQWYGPGNKETNRLLEERLAACDRTHLFQFEETKISALQGIELAPGDTIGSWHVTSRIVATCHQYSCCHSGRHCWKPSLRTVGSLTGVASYGLYM